MKNHQRILHIRVNQGSKFQLQQTILIFLEQIYPQKIRPVKNTKK